MRPQVIFFDMGYTLLYPAPSFEAHFCEVLQRFGMQAAHDEVARVEPHAWRRVNTPPVAFTLSDEVAREFWLRYYRLVLDELAMPCPEGFCEGLLEILAQPHLYELYPDVVESVEALRARGFRLGILSNWEAWLEEHMTDLDLRRHFDPIIVSATVGLEKPDPAIFRLALAKAQVSPEEALYVGDSVTFDYLPAREVGMQAILIDRRGKLNGSPHPYVRSLGELLEKELLRG